MNNRSKLFVMMLLEFFIWGAWLPLIFSYLPSLGFSPVEQACILNAFAIAAIVGMFFSNQFCDRNFAAEKFLAFSHAIGGLAMLGLVFTKAFWPFFGLMLVHCLLFVPTLSIVNSITFAHLKDSQKEFGLVRLGGTLGWVLAAWPFTFIFVDWDKVHQLDPHGLVNWISVALSSGLTGDKLRSATVWTFALAGLASLALAAFSFCLPHTPPKKASEGAAEKLAWLEAVKLLGHPFVLVLWLVTLVDAFVHNCYFNWTGGFLSTPVADGGVGIAGNWVMPVMSVGQIMEMLTMFVLGATLKRLGWRTTMIIGILGHVARFTVYAYFPQYPWVIVAVQILHGISYAFFFATVYIFADAFFPKDARASAQGLFNVMILGLGPLLANTICPYLGQKTFAHDGITNYHALFLVPMICGIAAAVTLVVFFHPPKTPVAEAAR
jgi:MFS family permease